MKTYGLVGSSGTGKSHRALLVAATHGIDYIIDDGLLITEGKILAGRSAKRERTGLAAVRRALFQDPSHAGQVRRAITRSGADQLLVLGTSATMILRIVSALDLPPPRRIMDITEVASKEEIDTALSVRRRLGKHVIPAPTMEVKKSFSGYLVDSLRFLRRDRRRARESKIIEKSVVRPTFSALGHFYISDRVIASLAEYAAMGIRGIHSVGRIAVRGWDEGIVIEMDVTPVLSSDLATALQEVQRTTRQVVEHMTALNVLAVNVAAQKLVVDSEESGEDGGS